MERRGDIVFDFDVVVFAKFGDGVDARRLADEPAEQVEVVRALVEQDAAALAFPCRAPAAGVVVGLGAVPVGDSPTHAEQVADRAVGAQAFDVLPLGESALLEHAGKDEIGVLLARGFVVVDGLLRFECCHSQGLFNKHMQPALKRELGKLRVSGVRRGDEHGIDRARGDHLLGRVEALAAVLLDALLHGVGAAACGGGISETRDIAEVARVEGGHRPAAADDAEADGGDFVCVFSGIHRGNVALMEGSFIRGTPTDEICGLRTVFVCSLCDAGSSHAQRSARNRIYTTTMSPTAPLTPTSSTMFDHVKSAPPDAIIGLTEAYKADNAPGKINLAVGVYKDAQGDTPTLAAVRTAEHWLVDREPNKVYLGIDGSPGYGKVSRALLFGNDNDLVNDAAAGGRTATFQAPGGTGALRIAADYLGANHAGTTVWLSDPTWPNHPSIFKGPDLGAKTYPYLDSATNALAFDAMTQALQAVKPGDVVLLHGCCHNPTGVDPTPEQWRAIGEMLNDRGALPLIDFAYQGFAVGVQEDAVGLRILTEVCGELIVCNSYSKNFGLYRERVGAMTVVTRCNDSAKAVQSQVKACIRRNYSNPPAHGALVVEHILGSQELTAQWLDELTTMRERIARMRTLLRTTLDTLGITLGQGDNDFIEHQNGMFTMSGLTREQVGPAAQRPRGVHRRQRACECRGDDRAEHAGIVQRDRVGGVS